MQKPLEKPVWGWNLYACQFIYKQIMVVKHLTISVKDPAAALVQSAEQLDVFLYLMAHCVVQSQLVCLA